MCGCYEMLYTDAHMRYAVSILGQSQLATRRNLVNHGEFLAETVAHSRLPVEDPNQEVEEVLSGALKITQCGIVKRRSYGSI